MIITIVSSPRSGSLSLWLWTKKIFKKKYTVLFEPCYDTSPDYISDFNHNLNWINTNDNYIINTKYVSDSKGLNSLIEISDKVIFLYREDIKSQIESWVLASITNNWRYKYNINNRLDEINKQHEKIKHVTEYLKMYKSFIESFGEKNNLKVFSYEDLYFNNKIDDLKTFLNIDTNTNFPIGSRYRHDIKTNKLL